MALGRFVKGVSVYAGSGIALKALSLVIAPIYTRFISVEDFGAVNLADSVANLVAAVLGLSLPAALNRLYFKRTEEAAIRRFVATLALGSLGLLVAAYLVCLAVGPPLVALASRWFSVPFFPFLAIALATAMATQHLQLWQRLQQAEERPRAYAWTTMLNGGLTAAAVLTLVVGVGAGGVGLLSGRLVGALVVAFGLLVVYRSRLAGERSRDDLTEAMRFGASLVPYQVMVTVLALSDRLVIEAYLGTERVGVYALAAVLGGVMIFVNRSVVAAWHPLFYKRVETPEGRRAIGRDATLVLLGTSCVGSLGALISDDFVRVVFDARYAEAGALVAWLLAGYVVWQMFALVNLQILERERGTISSAITVASGVLNVALNLWLVPIYGITAAAVTTFAAYAFQAIVGLVVAQRLRHVPYDWGTGLAAMLVLGLALGVTQLDWGSREAGWVARLVAALVVLAFASLVYRRWRRSR